MKRVLTGVALGALAVPIWGVMITRNQASAQVKNFDITWIDTEGGDDRSRTMVAQDSRCRRWLEVAENHRIS